MEIRLEKRENMRFEKDYFLKEIRCDFEVSSHMKHAWAAEMEVLQCVAEICEKNGLQYYAHWGTLLGAVRHGGYIPWDDDIDIALKREEYNRLIEILPEELPEGFVIGGIHSNQKEEKYSSGMFHLYVGADASLWDINEYRKVFHDYPYSLVGIDIFPLDHVPYDLQIYETQKKLIEIGIAIKSNWKDLEESKELQRRLLEFEELSGVTLPKENKRYHLLCVLDSIMSLYHAGEGKYLNDYMWKNRNLLEESWYEDVIKMPFETMEIAVPREYDAVLKKLYGDYHKCVRGKSAHDYPYYKVMQPLF